ncbi:UNVERIFIED_CONTAM: putative aminoacrylate hydrolase RutD [Sesamum latifolium]|uniref:Aminoacrylate hydrolase RutD n=1 Tax=Sesamum latifolium TaxID=2727402 RepID=A0AAW2T6V5_9LAMI
MYQNQDGDALPNNNNGIKIFYRTYGKGPVKVLMIIGLAGTHDSWGPQIKGLVGTLTPNDEELPADDRSNGDGEVGADMEVCAFDNRGMGRSSVPTKKSEYTTRIMAKDAIALMDHLGWEKAHVFGHSMGAMIACKLAAMVPERILSLALLNVTVEVMNAYQRYNSCGRHGNFVIIIDRQTLSIAMRFLRAKTPEQRAAVDLDTHYSQEYLEEYVGEKTRRSILYQVNKALSEVIKASESMTSLYEWTNLSNKSSGCKSTSLVSLLRSNSSFFIVGSIEKLRIFLAYFFGLFVLAFENIRRGVQRIKPVRLPSLKMKAPSHGNKPFSASIHLSRHVPPRRRVAPVEGLLLHKCGKMETLAADGTTEAPTKWEFSCDLEVDYQSEEIARIVHATLAVDKELQPDKVKRQMTVSNGKLSVHFEAVEARFLRASYSAFVDVLTLATKTIEEFGQGMTMAL